MKNFDINRHSVIGVAKLQLEYSNASIYILGYEDDDHHFVGFSEDEAQEIFKPRGAVYAHNFAKSNSRFADSLIAIRVDLNYEDKREKCKYINADKIRGYASPITYIDESDFSLIDNNHNSELRESLDANQPFFKSKEYLYKQYDSNGTSGVFCYWKTDDKFYREHKDVVCERKKLFFIIREDKMHLCDGYIDTLSDEEIATFILNSIKEINISIDNLDTIPSFVKKLHIPKSILESRVSRFNEILQMYSLMRNGVLQLAASPLLSEVVNKSLNAYSEEYIQDIRIRRKKDIADLDSEYEAKVVACKKVLKENKEKLSEEYRNDLTIITKEVSKRKMESQELSEKIVSQTDEVLKLNEQLQILEERKDRIIEDYSVVRDVLGGINTVVSTTVSKNLIRINDMVGSGVAIANSKDFTDYVRENFKNSNVKSKNGIAASICKLLSYKVLLLPDIRVVKALINSFGSCKYVSVSVGVNWNSFECLWHNGLETIIESCKKDISTVHILVLQNMNLSYMPCYMSPINDILIGLADTLPSGDILPQNLWILGTRSKERAMDMPVEYIREYGCLKYDDYYEVTTPVELGNRFILADTILSFPKNEDDKGEISDYTSYLDDEL